MEFDAFSLDASTSPFQEDFAKAAFCGREGDVHTVGGGLLLSISYGCLLFDTLLRVCGFGFHDADNAVVSAANANRAADWWVDGKQLLGHTGIEYADIFLVFHFDWGEVSTLLYGASTHFRVPWYSAKNVAIDAAGDSPDIVAHDAGGYDDGHAGDCGADALNVGIGESVFDGEAAIGCGLLFFGRFDAAQDDVAASQASNLFLGFTACPLPHRQHGNDRGNAEDDAEDGKQGSEPMHPEASKSQADRPL